MKNLPVTVIDLPKDVVAFKAMFTLTSGMDLSQITLVDKLDSIFV